LLKLDPEHRAAVVELGTNHPGELAPLVRMAAPQYGVITNIGREHLEHFGDVSGVAREEGMLAEGLPANGCLFLNGDGDWAEGIAARCPARVVKVGSNPGNAWRLRWARMDLNGVTFSIESPQAAFSGEYRVNLLGKHQAGNALLAIAVAAELGLNPEEIRRGLEVAKPARYRLQLWESGGVRILEDVYNANADSMRAALETLQGLSCRGRRVAVLGDMAELGTHTQAAHEEVGRRAAELGVGQLFAVGRMAPAMAAGARAAGLNRVIEFGQVEPAANAVRSFVKSGDLVLVKASRASRFERISDLLKNLEASRRS
jgi:UDP-N-acetylmuramoyl-tripeptide--D-alanyl-D-alanine ligase